MTRPAEMKMRNPLPKRVYRTRPTTAAAVMLMDQFLYRLKLSGLSDAEFAKKASIDVKTLGNWRREQLPTLRVFADCLAWLGYTLVPTKCDVNPDRRNPVFEIVDPLWVEMERARDRENGIDVGPEPGSLEWKYQNSVGDEDDLSPSAEDIERERFELQIPLETRQRHRKKMELKKIASTTLAERAADQQDKRRRALEKEKRANKEKMKRRLARRKGSKASVSHG